MAPPGDGKEMNIDIQMEEGEPLGAVPNDTLTIIKIQAGTLAEGKLKVGGVVVGHRRGRSHLLQIGDQILKVNGIASSDTTRFFKQLRFAPPCATLTILRDSKKADELQHRCHIPPRREKNINRWDGYEYLIVKLVWQPSGARLGLGIRHYQNRVLVSRCDAGSVSAARLVVGDHILDLNGLPVTDKFVAQHMLLRSLKARGEVSLLIARPDSMAAKHWTQSALSHLALTSEPPSVRMNDDVRTILAREKEKLGAKKAAVPKSILRQPKTEKTQNAVFINEQSQSKIIASDNEGKQLCGVRK